MDQKYDQKFEEMKQYIPFLESMIKRLETNSSGSANPRQAQLDKIRSLRDLLLDKKKRMKMENLLKCEQVLVNLYSKVEQRETLPDVKLTTNPVQNSKLKNKDNDLEVVRNKLKTVTAIKVEEGQETLPEIARASIIEELCTPGSKEPALFQRRPNIASISPGRSPMSPNKSTNLNASKRNYTRVLVSPEQNSKRWEIDEKTSEKPLFSRRSQPPPPPHWSPKKSSPTHIRKEKKKSSKKGHTNKANDLNITLNVPEESLNSLNSKDILSRIMNCSDKDVDIETLREAKRQILNELKHTGAKCDDISDLLLKSYKTPDTSKKKTEVEEGELSDSESEAIQSIYGNFILDDDENSSKIQNSKTQEKARKIQICLVINSDKDDPSGDMKKDKTEVPCNTDTTDFEMYNKNPSINSLQENKLDLEKESKSDDPVLGENDISLEEKSKQNQNQSINTTTVEQKVDKPESKNKTERVYDIIGTDTRQPANFYKPLKDEIIIISPRTLSENTLQAKESKENQCPPKTEKYLLKKSSLTDNLPEITAYLRDTENTEILKGDNEEVTVEIPLLNEPSIATQKPKKDVVSEIDILQALKNEILSESLSIPGPETTPLLHQPKVTKVASAQEIAPKKRISIEKYKTNSAASAATVNSLFMNDPTFSDCSSSSWKEDNLRKQSLKLTEKECERFFSAKLDLDDDNADDYDIGISDLEPDVNTTLNDIYGNLVPKSPDHDEPSSTKNVPPVIIPVEPVKATLAPSKADVDMRKLAAMLSPNSMSPSMINTTKLDQNFMKSSVDKARISLDPRVKRDVSQLGSIDTSVPIKLGSDRMSRPLLPTPMAPNMTPNRVIHMLPDITTCVSPSLAASMTPNRNPNMTPRQSFGIDDNSAHKHVYAPIFQSDNNEQPVAIERERKYYWEKSEKESEPRNRDGSRWDLSESRDVNPNRDPRASSVHRETPDFSKSRFGEYYNHSDNFNLKYNERRDSYSRSECPRTPLPSFGRQDGSTTPSHTFGRLDAPMTPIHPFGRSECPPTPNQFSRADCPLTPSHPFGRPDCPQTLNHPLGRIECPSTPIHPFGRLDMPMTPSHPFGRSEPSRDPRLNRNSDYDHYLNDDTDRRKSGFNISETSSSESYRDHRERKESERYNYSEHGSRHYKEQPFRRDSSVGRALARDFKNDRSYSRDRGYGRAVDEHHRKNESNVDSRRGFTREQSIGRSVPTDGRRHNSSSRDPSINRTRDSTDYSFSVKPDAGTSFTINTSVRSTFQDFLDNGKNTQIFDNNFDNRRKRAASVGRTLCRESSVSRSFRDTPKKTIVATDNIINRNNTFRRASSVGRDVMTSETERSFKDIKAEFEKYRLDHGIHKSKGFHKSIDNRDPKRKDKLYDLKESRKNNKPFDVKEPKRNDKPYDIKEPRRIDKPVIINKSSNPPSERDVFKSESVGFVNKKPYSPRKNSRDPRLRRELQYSKNKYINDNQREKEMRNIGIVYSNDNISKGTILGSGYGVKNYKIPKIKRLVEEKEEKIEEKKEDKIEEKKAVEKTADKKDKIEEKATKGKEEKIYYNKDTPKPQREKKASQCIKPKVLNKPDKKIEVNNAAENICQTNTEQIEKCEKRVTRLSLKNDSLLQSADEDSIVKPKKTKKPFVYDSDSEYELDKSEDLDFSDKQETDLKKTSKNNIDIKDTLINENSNKEQNILLKDIVCTQTLDQEITPNSKKVNQLEPCFSIDDLELFSDNIGSDPVIDNINALIADLDNDIEPSPIKTSTGFSNNVTVENMLDDINSGEDDNLEAASADTHELAEVNKHAFDQSAKFNELLTSIDNNSKCSVTSNNQKETQIMTTGSKSQINNIINSKDLDSDFTKRDSESIKPLEDCLTKSSKSLDIEASVITRDNIVSTTEENHSENNEEEKGISPESNSVPDSTNEITSKTTVMEESLPDSTNETRSDTNSIVTSSRDSLELENKDNTNLANNDTTSINSIGNILSILQDKSKLKEILSLLSDKSGENEKIKKKLEKLSEIVSDDDDEKKKEPNVTSQDINTKLPDDSVAIEFDKDKANTETQEKSEIKETVIKEKETRVTPTPNISDELLNKSNDTDSTIDSIDKTNPALESDIIVGNINTESTDDAIAIEFEKDKANTETTEKSEITETVIKKNTVGKEMLSKNKKGKSKKKSKAKNKNTSKGVKRITRSAILQNKVKKPSRELLKLQKDIKEMFISEDVMNATGIRMCRLAKLDDKSSKLKEYTSSHDSSGPMVVLDKFKETETAVDTVEKKNKKKPGPKPKTKPVEPIEVGTKTGNVKPLKCKPGPKSKTKLVHKSDDEDPYAFESDSVSENNFSTRSVDNKDSSDSENESIGSSQSFGSTDLLIELKKKPKRKRSSWKAGIIKPKNRKKKPEPKLLDTPLSEDTIVQKTSNKVSVLNSFTDKLYCFYKNIDTYSCRLCAYSGDDIVNHYKQEHPHSEIPLSRLSPDMAKEAIEQCEEINFQAISKIPSDKYVCRFCFKEFAKKKAVLETFFWHVVSMHTGEYKQLCTLCPMSSKCPFNLDIPPPPKDVKGQLIGYICEKCNFTQISLENLKTHVIVRHNDEQTEVYTINLSATSRLAMINALSSHNIETEKPRVLRSTRSNQSAVKGSDDHSDMTDSDPSNEPLSPAKRCIRPKKSISLAIEKPSKHNLQSKITFENEDNLASTTDESCNSVVKVKIEKGEESPEKKRIEELTNNLISEICNEENLSEAAEHNVPVDIFVDPHFKVTFSNGGSKEYVCCINGQEHYNTSLLISFKKHVQLKHSEIWDGYCSLCKVIVTPQGHHNFKDCLQHYLDKHMDNFPVLEAKKTGEQEETKSLESKPPSNKNYINVRPISELLFNDSTPKPAVELPTLPKIENVMSLGAEPAEPPQASSSYQPVPVLPESPVEEKQYKYEEVQAEVMSKKQRVVLDTMMSKAKLVNVFKCAGRYCSFSSDSAEEALLHASTHQRVGGENSLSCAYCDFDCAGNAIDLVMHVFKVHGSCPYVCGHCFYRAAASQLVSAHSTRIHSTLPQKILSTVNVAPPQSRDSSMLPREVVVHYYVCPHACKFRTYTAGKFCEHLDQRHSRASWHDCNMCSESFPTAAQLVHHMKAHELNLYQCTWCVHGADTEPGLMFHASQKHPGKQPQAYLRVITNKDGSSEFRVLPLASFNKSKVVVEEVTPVSNKENPVREAERSIDLEKLIGHTNKIIESMVESSTAVAPLTETESAVTSITMDESDILADNEPQNAATILQSSILPERPVTPPERPVTPPERSVTPLERSVTPLERSVPPLKRSVIPPERSVTPLQQSVTPPELPITPPERPITPLEPPAIPPEPPVTPPATLAINEQVTPKIKAEPTEIPTLNVSDVIVCLDSDEEEEARQLPAAGAAVPDDASASQPATKESSAEALKLFKVICPTMLYTCPSCTAILKTPTAFKSHVNSCCSNLTSFRCPHCDTSVGNKFALYAHYAAEHSGETCETVCGICQVRFKTLSQAKRHMKTKHKVSEYALKPSKDKDDVSVFILSADYSVLDMNVCAICDARFATMGHGKRHMKYVHGVSKCVVSSRKNHESKLECVLSGVATKSPVKRKLSASAAAEPPAKITRFGPADIDRLPINPIMDELVECTLCEFKTKVRLNMVRHLQAHAEQQPAPHTAPINPVPHLETNEKHFDKMLNLASSSNTGRGAAPAAAAAAAAYVPPEAASRYPRFVEARSRHTCGARGCSYISVDEAMLRCHWSTLHEGSNDFHCVHCPPYQHLDTSKPLTPARIIAHLKMHDATLYACSACPYYHYKRQVLDKHLLENHNREGRFMIVREAASSPAGASVPPAAAPTMDLKPWQCGMCSFKSMLRPEVAEHCAKLHQSKMQFRCYYCPFRTSGLENVAKHQTNSHPGLKPEVCYYYYREGSIPDEVDGSPRWMKQRQKFGTPENLEVKSEEGVSPTPVSLKQLIMAPQRPIPSPPAAVDLNIVKKEVDDSNAELTMDQLKRKYGEFCKPNGLKYQCPHCQVTEEGMEAMQSHLYEELSYRKWGCSKCEYKGFHRARLNEHYASEHRGQNLEPIQRPTDVNIEKWVFHFLETQTKAIAKAKESLPMQRVIEPTPASTSKLLEVLQHDVKTSAPQEKADKFGTKQLEEAFGPLGEPADSFYCCPKCNFKVKEEAAMRDHLEIELTKIRWCCSNCVNNFQTYHEAQFHCKSEHPGQASRPVEAPRDPGLRAAWASAALAKQAQAMRTHHTEPAQLEATQPPETDNSLLVVRFEKAAKLNAPEQQSQQVRKRPAPDTDDSDYDSESDNAVTTKPTTKCPHCSFRTRYGQCLRTHIYRHYNLKPLTCTLCDFSSYRSTMVDHLANHHYYVADAKYMKPTKLPDGPPVMHDVKIMNTRRRRVDSWWQSVKEKEYATKSDHINTKNEKVQCMTCKSIVEVGSIHEHHEDEHSTARMRYTFLKLVRNRNLVCGYCKKYFKLLLDLTLHHSAIHHTLKLKYTAVLQSEPTSLDSDDDCEMTSYTKPVARPKMVARKSTSKLPAQTVARKSTTRLPYHERDDEEYSYYGTRPTPLDEYEHVTTLMSFNNTMMPFTVQKLSELIKLSPVVRVTDMKAGS